MLTARTVGHVTALAVAILGLAAAGCGGSQQAPPPTSSSPAALAAFLADPTTPTTPTFAPGAYTTGGYSQAIVVGVRGLNASYRLVLTPTPPPAPAGFSSPAPQTPAPLQPLAGLVGKLPPAPAGYTYATATVFVSPVTPYTVAVTGCDAPDPSGSCASPQTIVAGSFQTGCGFPPPLPVLFPSLAVPSNGSTNVPPTLGAIVLQGAVNPTGGAFGPASVALVPSAGGSPIPIPSFAPAPSPVPSAAPNGSRTFVAGAIPPLGSGTIYGVVVTYSDWNGLPPLCYGTQSRTIGSFSTQ